MYQMFEEMIQSEIVSHDDVSQQKSEYGDATWNIASFTPRPKSK